MIEERVRCGFRDWRKAIQLHYTNINKSVVKSLLETGLDALKFSGQISSKLTQQKSPLNGRLFLD